ncbi:Asr1405/Asl0597 family protein [Leptodesmis sp.]|uniref:Asr1405/Asl0597 family protein n=1 Tax=Leptodesmis sp. TaxID=3100501 RepID=UPI0040534B70
MQPSCTPSLTVPILTIARCDRWLACQRLQDLSIPCHCTEDGCLQVEVTHPTAIAQVRSVIQQLTASRTVLVDWLEQCWHQPAASDFH